MYAWIASEPHRDTPTTFDSVLDKYVQTPTRMPTSASRREGCLVDMASIHAWLSRICRPLGSHPILGVVPVDIVGLRNSTDCISVDDIDFIRVEFVVHRFGDRYGVHYEAQVSRSAPYRIASYRRMGAVPSGSLWMPETM